MAGEWQTISQKEVDSEGHGPTDASLNIGIRKRKFEGQEEEEEAGDQVVKKGWGATTKSYPGVKESNNTELDALLGSTPTLKNTERRSTVIEKTEGGATSEKAVKLEAGGNVDDATIKTEDNDQDNHSTLTPAEDKTDDLPLDVVFKKRKSKGMRQK